MHNLCLLSVHISLYLFISISRSSQCSTTGVTKAVVCAILSVWDGAYKRTLAVNRKV